MSEEDTMTPLREKEARHTLAASGLLVPLADQLAAAHRAGAREALTKLSEWAFDAMEGEGSEAFTAYENCHVTAENLKAHYAEPEEEKKG